jgi:hypothetical protein
MTVRKRFNNHFSKDIHRWKFSQRRALLLAVGVIIPGIQLLWRMPYHVLYARNASCTQYNEDTDHADSSSSVSDLHSEGAWFENIRR